MHKNKIIIKTFLLAILALLFMLSGCTSVQASKSENNNAAAEVSQTQSVKPSPSPSVSPSPSKEAQPKPSKSPEPSKATAEDKYFTKEEIIKADEEKGEWNYSSPTTWVQVKRVFIKDKVQTYYAAEVRIKEGETEIAGFADPKKPGNSWLPLYKIQRSYKTVIAISGDYMQQKEPEKKGIIIHQGKVLLDNDGADTLALYPDGTMRTFGPGETTPEKLMKDGVKNTFSFGPTLIENGKICEGLSKHRVARANPRSAAGMIEPYHYLLVVVDGRQANYSKGMTMQELAEVFAKYNCKVAFNLDGGQSATMSFMGNNINKYGGSTTGQRAVKDALMFGVSDKVQK